MTTVFDRAYAAGFFDGDGSVGVSSRENLRWAPRSHAQVSQKSVDPLIWLRDRWEGSLFWNSSSQIWCWKVVGPKASRFFSDTAPYLIIKEVKAALAVQMQNRMNHRGKPASDDYLKVMGEFKGAIELTYPVPPRPQRQTTDVAYAAGLFDAEGSITLRQFPDRFPLIYLSVSQKDPEILCWLRERWGGKVKKRPAKGYGKEPTHEWYLYSKMARGFLRSIQPWLIVKRRLTDICVTWDDLVTPNGRYQPEQKQQIVELLSTWSPRW